MNHIRYQFFPSNGSIDGTADIDVVREGLFSLFTNQLSFSFNLDYLNQLHVWIGLSRYLFYDVAREELEKKLLWIAQQPKAVLKPYRVLPKAFSPGSHSQRGIRYIFCPSDGSIVGGGPYYKKIDIRGKEFNAYVGFAFDYLWDDYLKVTVEKTHYEFYNVKREELEDTLIWFSQQSPEALAPFEIKDCKK